MSQSIREQIEAREAQILSPFATKASESLGRQLAIYPDAVRTCFQRDRDRILHSKSFRRLKHKTQVFIDPLGDHYRTRLTHTLEVAQIARTIGRALRLNEDLIEAIALGHDVGHSPFGHAGERALDEAIQAYWAQKGETVNLHQDELPLGVAKVDEPRHFRHYEQSLRIVDVLENLNLTEEVRMGIGGHSKGRKDLSADDEPISSLEAGVVKISDRIAYLNHDIDDALRSGMIDSVPSEFDALGTTYSSRIGILVEDVITQSLDQPYVRVSRPLVAKMNGLKEWMFENVYLRYPVVFPDVEKAVNLVKELFDHFVREGELPEGYVGLRGAVDYIAGMTDRFAIETYEALKLPAAWERR
ncbi:MAG: HD domain-containing protein [Armatimonadetes bacterium]|nr:HD domain-containing protein [Armatimonadota bacterium]